MNYCSRYNSIIKRLHKDIGTCKYQCMYVCVCAHACTCTCTCEHTMYMYTIHVYMYMYIMSVCVHVHTCADNMCKLNHDVHMQCNIHIQINGCLIKVKRTNNMFSTLQAQVRNRSYLSFYAQV